LPSTIDELQVTLSTGLKSAGLLALVVVTVLIIAAGPDSADRDSTGPIVPVDSAGFHLDS